MRRAQGILGGRAALVLVVAATLQVMLLSGCRREAEPPPEGTPRLVVMIVVDQMRGDYLERFDAFWVGGFRYLIDHAVHFENAHHDHAITATAPGHATLATGCTPGRHTVFSNYWVDRESGEEVYSAANDDWESTPERLACPTLGAWIKSRYPEARVFAASQKDRSAVLMGGRRADGVFYYDDEIGGWETGEEFYGEPPEWLEEFNGERYLDRHFGKAWEPLPAPAEALAAARILPFDMGPLELDFPIGFGGLSPAPGSSFYAHIYGSPFADGYLARLAERMIGAEALGGDEVPDLLALGFSATDSVGHSFGPDSPQLLDTLRRLDGTLGELFDFLDRRVGLDNVVLALSSDHGVVPVPEVRQALELPGRRAATPDVLCMQSVYERLRGRFGEGAWLLPGPFVNREAVDEAGLEYTAVESAAEGLIEQCDGVTAVWTRSELTRPEIQQDPVGRLFANSFPPEVGPDFLVQWDEYFLASRTTTASHGTVWPYDSHVPLMIAGPGITPRRVVDRARTTDLAPTLATMLDVPVPEDIDGAVLALDR